MPRSIREVLQALRSREARIEAADLHPHEIDGSNFPEGVQEYDATEALPDPLETLQEIETPDRHKPDSWITGTGNLIGRSVNIPRGQRQEVLAIRLREESQTTTFTLIVSQEPIEQSSPSTPVDFDRYTSINNPGAQDDHAYALIEWGAGSVRKRALLDIIPGQVLSLSGSFLRVIGVNNIAGVGPEIIVSAFVSLLPHSSRKSPTFTRPLGDIAVAPATVETDGLPPFAKSIKVVRNNAAAPFSVRFTNGAALVISESSIAANQECPELDIPGHATEIIVLNGAVAANFAMIYFLDL